VHCRVTAGSKTRSLRQAPGVTLFSDDWEIHLGMAAKTQIIVAGHKHLGMH